MFLFGSILLLSFIPVCFLSVDDKCRNGLSITVKWWNQEPYIYRNPPYPEKQRAGSSFEGTLPVFLEHALRYCCNKSTANYTQEALLGPARIPEVLSTEEFDLLVPVPSRSDAISFHGYPFVGVFESPGVAVLMKKNVSGVQLLLAVLEAWPILVFILMSASLAGVIIWLLEKRSNTDQFPESFARGVFEGFWWAFITMTTVGYGDKAPQTITGKILGFVWMMAGLIITTMFISIITSAMTTVSLSETSSIKGAKISVVNQSEEHRLGIREMAHVQALPDIEEVFQNMLDRRVDGALVDVHGLKHHIRLLNSHNIQVATILPNQVKYGVVFGSNSSSLQKCMQGLVNKQEFALFQLLAENTGGAQTTISVAEDYFGSGGIFSVTVYAGFSLFVLLFAAGMAWELYMKRSAKKTKDSGQEKFEGSKSGTRQDGFSGDNSDVVLEMNSTPRLLFGESAIEQVLSRQSIEVTKMDEEFRDFRKTWVAKYADMLDKHRQQQTMLCNNQDPSVDERVPPVMHK